MKTLKDSVNEYAVSLVIDAKNRYANRDEIIAYALELFQDDSSIEPEAVSDAFIAEVTKAVKELV